LDRAAWRLTEGLPVDVAGAPRSTLFLVRDDATTHRATRTTSPLRDLQGLSADDPRSLMPAPREGASNDVTDCDGVQVDVRRGRRLLLPVAVMIADARRRIT